MPQRLTFVEVRILANKNGLSMERNGLGGFRVWRQGESGGRFARPSFPTLSEAKAFIEAECEEEGCYGKENEN